MSDTNLPVVLSQRARQDFVHILRYSAEQWGKAQLETYRYKIDTAIDRIARNPDLGALRNDLDQPYRTFPVGVHVIVYRRQNNQVRIIRILHQRMDPANRHRPELNPTPAKPLASRTTKTPKNQNTNPC